MTADITEPAVQALIDAINAGDRDAFFATLTPDATMSDDGRNRDLRQWVDQELFSSQGRMEVESATHGGRSLLAANNNATYGTMHTFWRFTVRDGKISRFETGQAGPAA
jgi:ketosteroid isomerase-like protein